MMDEARFSSPTLPRVVAALHLLPSAVSRRADASSLSAIVAHAVAHARIAVGAGLRALYFQDTRDAPIAPRPTPQTVTTMTAVGNALRAEFPDLVLGVSCMAHGAREPLDIAHAVGADFVRLKVYIGTMSKMEGLISGCAFEAIQHRADIGAARVKIFADVYDRLGVPVAPMPLTEACRQAVEFGRADGLILTGGSESESRAMFEQVRPLGLRVPLMLGGGATSANVAGFSTLADSFIVHGAFARAGLPRENDMPIEWSADLIREFIAAAS